MTASPMGKSAQIPTIADALRAILLEVADGADPYSSYSYLPDHLVQAARTALEHANQAAHQHAHNALSTAAWHIARGESSQALTRLRRAQAHLTTAMQAQGGAA